MQAAGVGARRTTPRIRITVHAPINYTSQRTAYFYLHPQPQTLHAAPAVPAWPFPGRVGTPPGPPGTAPPPLPPPPAAPPPPTAPQPPPHTSGPPVLHALLVPRAPHDAPVPPHPPLPGLPACPPRQEAKPRHPTPQRRTLPPLDRPFRRRPLLPHQPLAGSPRCTAASTAGRTAQRTAVPPRQHRSVLLLLPSSPPPNAPRVRRTPGPTAA